MLIMEITNYICGYHVYSTRWTPNVGKELKCRPQDDTHDQYTVAVYKIDDTLVRTYQKIVLVILKKKQTLVYCVH